MAHHTDFPWTEAQSSMTFMSTFSYFIHNLFLFRESNEHCFSLCRFHTYDGTLVIEWMVEGNKWLICTHCNFKTQLARWNNVNQSKSDTREDSASHKQCFTQILQSYSLPGFDFADDGCTTTCIVITVLGRSPKGALHCAIFLSFSRILPPLISFTSLALFGTIVLSTSRIITELETLHKQRRRYN